MMKLTLGGIISVSLAVCISVSAGALFLFNAGLVQNGAGVVLYILTFPLILLCGMTGGHGGGQAQLHAYLLLLIPYSFVVGYSIAGCIRWIRWAGGRGEPPVSQATDEELSRLLAEHRKDDP